MYHDEKVVDGVLYVKSTPNGAWERLTSARADALKLMYDLRIQSPEHFGWVVEQLRLLEPGARTLLPEQVINELKRTESGEAGVPGKCCAGCVYCAPDKYLPRKAGW